MKLVFRSVMLLAAAAVLLAAAGIAAWEQTHSPWWALGAIIGVALALAKIVDEALGIGVFFGRRQAERDAAEREEPTLPGMENMPPGMAKAVMEALKARGLRPISAHQVGGGAPDEDEEEIVVTMKMIADMITDGDLKEFAFHFTHIAQDCPGSLAHAKRMQEVVAHIEARLHASTVAAQNDTERPVLH